jgi:hypothetical protein
VVQEQSGFATCHESPRSRDPSTQQRETTIAAKIYLSVFAAQQSTWPIAMLGLSPFLLFARFFLAAFLFFLLRF